MNKYRINTELPVLKTVVQSENLEANEKYAPFYTALDNCAGFVPLNMCIALFLAMLISQPVKGVKVYRTIFYIPTVISGVVGCSMKVK